MFEVIEISSELKSRVSDVQTNEFLISIKDYINKNRYIMYKPSDRDISINFICSLKRVDIEDSGSHYWVICYIDAAITKGELSKHIRVNSEYLEPFFRSFKMNKIIRVLKTKA